MTSMVIWAQGGSNVAVGSIRQGGGYCSGGGGCWQRRGKEGGGIIIVKSGDGWLMNQVDDVAVCFVMHSHANGT
jgi:hypothetical protein